MIPLNDGLQLFLIGILVVSLARIAARITRSLYSALAWMAQPLLRRKLRRRARTEPGYGYAVHERFGYYKPENLGHDAAGQWIWIHAVSLGETRAAALLLEALRQELPHLRLLLTHSTATGRAEGQKLLRFGDLQVWLPWDTAGAVRRFLRQFRPRLGVLMETEVWPNLCAQCRAAGVPLLLVNARLNTSSMTGAQRLSALARPAYESLSAVFAQTDLDAQRLGALGAPVRGVLGNLKFDIQPDPLLLAQGAAWRFASPRPVVLLASSREGEERAWLKVWQQNSAAQEVQWLIVPRHPQRFSEVEQMLREAGIKVGRRSTWGQRLPPYCSPYSKSGSAQVWLGDSLGEMPLYYASAHVGLLGASFEPLGGQNLIEAAACACPMVLGQHTFNFRQAAELAVESGAARRVSDMKEAVEMALAWLDNPAELEEARRAALSFAQEHRGAARATAQAIVKALPLPAA